MAKKYLPARVNKASFAKHAARRAPKPLVGRKLMRGGTRY